MSPAMAQQSVRICDGREATIVGTSGNDTLIGTAGPDVIAGLQGNDVIRGLGGDDVICGGLGNDIIRGGAGFDIIFGAQGSDVIYAADGASSATRQDVRGARMFGGAGDDTIHGSNRWDRMQGGSGNDVLFGYEGRDWMRAGADNDRVNGGPGIDDLHGGNGRDTIELTANDVVRGGAGLDQCNFVALPASIRSCGDNVRERPPSPNSFSYTATSGTRWSGRVDGLVPVGLNPFGDGTGTCYLVVGELTLNATAGVVNNPDDNPQFGVFADGEYVPSSLDCDLLATIGLPHAAVLDLQIVQGTTVPVLGYVLVPEGLDAVTDIVIGDPDITGDTLMFDAAVLPEVPSTDGGRVGALPAPRDSIGPNATFDWVGAFFGTEWTGSIDEIVEVETKLDLPGTCHLVLGTLVPTSVQGDMATGFDAPIIGGLAGGRYVDSALACDTLSAKLAGFRWILDADVAEGTVFRFWEEIYISDGVPADIDRILVGLPSDPVAVFTT